MINVKPMELIRSILKKTGLNPVDESHAKTNDIFRTIMFLLCICLFLFSAFKIAAKLFSYYEENKTYEGIRAMIQTPCPIDSSAYRLPRDHTDFESCEKPKTPSGYALALPYSILKGDPGELSPEGILSAYAGLKTQNNDLVGWISMPGFKKAIDYPIMKTLDNEFYLNHDFYGNKSYSGSIYMDASNSAGNPDRNIILYGHAMKDNSMFGNLRDYPENQNKYMNNTTIYIDFLNMRMEYQVFSAYYTESTFDYRRINFSDDSDYLSFLETIKNKSLHNFGVSLSHLDKIITLSTCKEDYGADGRAVIHARLVKQIVYDADAAAADVVDADKGNGKKIISANVYLKKLGLQYGDGTDAVFDPPFNTIKKEFSTKVPYFAETVRLIVEAEDPKARLTFALNGRSSDPSGLKLQEGNNTIKVRAVSIDGLYSRTYTINVLREPSGKK